MKIHAITGMLLAITATVFSDCNVRHADGSVGVLRGWYRVAADKRRQTNCHRSAARWPSRIRVNATPMTTCTATAGARATKFDADRDRDELI